MLVFRDYDKLPFLNAYGLTEDTEESLRAGRRGNVELRSRVRQHWEGEMFIYQFYFPMCLILHNVSCLETSGLCPFAAWQKSL